MPYLSPVFPEICARYTLVLKGVNMISSHRIAIVWVAVLFLGLQVAWAESDPNTQLADRFDVSFAWSRYGSPIQFYCEVDILDPNLILGMSRQGMITQFENGKGEIIDVVDQTLPRPPTMLSTYEAPRYRTRLVYPPKTPRRKKAIRSVLRLPPPASPGDQLIHDVQRCRMTLELDSGLLGPDLEINRVEGCFHVLVAESFEVR